MSSRLPVWWALLDLNQRPTGYEPAALTAELRALVLEGDKGLEVNPASLKEQGALEVRVSRSANLIG